MSPCPLSGNILSRSKYVYAAPGKTSNNPTKVVLYQYNDSQWGDLLTGYNGRDFSYDTMGNLTWRPLVMTP